MSLYDMFWWAVIIFCALGMVALIPMFLVEASKEQNDGNK